MTLEQHLVTMNPTSGTDSDTNQSTTATTPPATTTVTSVDPQTALLLPSEPTATPGLPDIEKLYECDECGQRFTREYYVQRHKLAVHTEDKPFKCTQCDRTFSQGQGLARHMISHTGEKKFVCERCQKTFGFKSNLDRHKRNICYKHELHNPSVQIPGTERRFKCDNCDKSFSLKSNYERHRRTVCLVQNRAQVRRVVVHRSPSSSGQHKCDVCQKVFGTPFNLTRHQKAVCYRQEYQNFGDIKHHSPTPLFTVKEELKFAADQEYEDSTFSTQDYQQQYEAISSAIKDEFGDMAEDYDTVDFTSAEYKTELENELGSVGQIEEKEVKPVVVEKEKKIFTCEQCGRSFGFRHNLDRHRRTGACQRNVFSGQSNTPGSQSPGSRFPDLADSLIQPNPLTELQQKVFADQHLLTQPQKKAPVVSPALKPHKCPKCENRFGTYQALNAHVKIHNKVNPYTCNVCDRIFVGKKELIRHKKLHTEGEIEQANETKHECCICALRFNSEQELANHFMIHVDEAPFKCEFCKASFSSESELTTHRKQHEGATVPAKIEAAYTGANKIVLYTTAGNAKPFIVLSHPQQADDLNASRDSGLGDVTDQAAQSAAAAQLVTSQSGQMMTILSVIEKPSEQAAQQAAAECPTLDEIMDNLSTLENQSQDPSDALLADTEVKVKEEVEDDEEPEKMCVGYQISNYTSQPDEPRDSPMTVTSSSCESPALEQEPSQEKVLGGYIELQPMTFPGQGSILYQCSFCHENFINSDNLMMHVKLSHLSGQSTTETETQNFTQHALMANI